MIFDAVLVARRGLGVDELRSLTPLFASAVRWAVFAEQVAPDLQAAERVARTDPPDELLGLRPNPDAVRKQALDEFRRNRQVAREFVARWRPRLFPPDDQATDG